MSRWVHYFSDPLPAGAADAKALLGGKGASLKEMTLAGIPVPPGFTIVAEACARYYALGQRWPDGLEAEVRSNLARLERETGRTFGAGARPLLVSVRSGAAVSMPGMMDTLLNCGLHSGLAESVGDAPWFWDRYREFILRFARTVAGLGEDALDPGGRAAPPRARVEALLARYAERAGKPFPDSPWAALAACIDAVFASWQSARAVAYRDRHAIRGLAGTAVNVQMMFPSEISGICFTQDPTRPEAGRMVIEGSYGLGEAVVSGDVSPDRFIVSRSEPRRVETVVGRKASLVAAFGESRRFDPAAPCLSPEQIEELCRTALRIEAHFGHPVDIEWGWADGRFALLQSRAIRGLDVVQEAEAARRAEVDRLKAQAAGRRRLWVAHNLGETLRTPTPLTWDIVRQFMSGSGGFGRLYRGLGYRPSQRVCDEGFLDLIGGRIYADPERQAELFWDGMPLTYDLDKAVADRSVLDRAPDRFDAARADALFLAKLPRNVWGMLRAARLMRRARASARRDFEERLLPPFLEYVRRERARDLAKLGDAEAIAELHDRRRRVLDEFGPESLKPGFFGGLAFDALEAFLVQLMGETEGRELARTLTLALDGDVTFEQDVMLHLVARGLTTLDAFLDRFGHRCIGEMELAVPRWREDPKYIEQTIARLRASLGRDPEEIHRRNAEKWKAAESELPDRLARWGGSAFIDRVVADLADARALLPYRETGKFYLMMGYALIRDAVEGLGHRWGLGPDVYFMRLDELDRFPRDRSALTAEIPRRRLRWQALQRLDLPELVDSNALDDLGLARSQDAAAELAGTAMAPGVATGVARIVHDPQQAGDLGAGYILVCASTDPGWTPLFLNARGLVVERGGVLSHGAIVARDFGIPAVACPDATRRIRDGATIRVDGNGGRVIVVETADSAEKK